MSLDPAGWTWPRLAAVSTGWTLGVLLTGWVGVAAAIASAKQHDTSGGDFVVSLPYGTRHLSILLAVALLPPLAALARKLVAG